MFLVKISRLYFEQYGCSRWNSVFFAGCFYGMHYDFSDVYKLE